MDIKDINVIIDMANSKPEDFGGTDNVLGGIEFQRNYEKILYLRR